MNDPTPATGEIGTQVTSKTPRPSRKLRVQSSERFHSLQLWWTVAVAVALTITYVVDANRSEPYPKTAKTGSLYERLPAEADLTGRSGSR